MENQIEILRRDLFNMEEKKDQLVQDLDENIKAYRVLEKSVNHMRTQLSAKTEQNFTLETKMKLSFEDFENRIDRLEDEKRELKNEIALLKQSEKSDMLAQMREEKKDEIILDLKAKFQMKTEQILTLEAKIQSLGDSYQTRIERLEVDRSDLQAENMRLQKSTKEHMFREQINANEEALNHAMSMKRELLDKIDVLQEKLNVKSEQAYGLQAKMDVSFNEFEKRIQRLIDEREDLKNKNKRLESQLRETEQVMFMKAEEYDDSKLKRELRMLEVRLAEAKMEKIQLSDQVIEIENRFETRMGMVNQELETLRMSVTQLNREKGGLLAKLKSGTMEDATLAQVEYEKLVREMQMNIGKLKNDYDRRVNDANEQLELEKTRAEVGKRKLKEALDMKVSQLQNQISTMELHHSEEVQLLREAHAKQMQTARKLPTSSSKPNLEILPQTDLDLIKELQEQLRNQQLRSQTIDENWSAKYDRLNQEWEERIRLLKSRQTGLSDVEKAELEEQMKFLQGKAEANFRAKQALESQIRSMEDKLAKSAKEAARMVDEVSTLQQEIIKQSKAHHDQLELLRQSPGREVNERLLNLVTDGMNFQHDKEERLVRLTQQLQDRERDLRDQLDEQKEFYLSEITELKTMNHREIEMTTQKFSSNIRNLQEELSRTVSELEREKDMHERTILKHKSDMHQERVDLDKSANIEQERLRAVYKKEKQELESVIQQLGDDLLREKQKREDQNVEFKKQLAMKKAELDEMHHEEIGTLHRVKSMQENKYASEVSNMKDEHLAVLENMTRQQRNREEQHAEEIREHQQKFRERVADLQSEIANKESRIRNLENTVEDQKASYEGANAELRDKISSLNGEIAELETYVIKCRDLEEQLVEFKQAAEYLEQQVSQLQQQLDEHMNDSNIILSKTKLENRAKQDHLEDALKQTRSELEVKTLEFDNLYEKHHETQQQYVKILKDYQVEKERNSTDMDDLKQVQKEVVDKLHQDRAQLQWQLQELKHQLENADNLKQQALRDLQKRHDTIAQQLDWDIRDLKYQLNQAQKVTELEVDRANTKGNKVVQQREFEIQTLKGQINQLNEQMQIEVAKERNRMKIKLDTSSAHIEQLNRERETITVDFQNRIGELRKENDELRQFQAHHAADSYRAEDLKYQVKQLQGKHDQNALEIQVWQAECMNKQERISALEKERDTVKRELAVFKNEVFSNQPMNMSNAQDFTKLQEDLARKDVLISNQKKEIQDLQMEVNLAKYQLESKSHPDVPAQKRMEYEHIMDLEKQMGSVKKKAKKREQELVGKYRESQETVKRLDGALRNALSKHGELNRTVLKLRQEVGYLQRRTERAESLISDGTIE